MSLKQQLYEDMKAAIKAGDKFTLGVIRLANAAIKHVEIAQREHGKQEDLDDQSVIAVLNRMVKQRQDSVALYQRAGRADLADTEHSEIQVIERYLPPKLDASQIDSAIQEAIAASGASGIADMGLVMTHLKSSLAGQADMRELSVRVKKALSR